MARNYQSGRRNWRGDAGRSNRWRDENEGRYPDADQDRDYDYRYTREDEGDSSVRAGSFDQGRVQYGGRDTRDHQPSLVVLRVLVSSHRWLPLSCTAQEVAGHVAPPPRENAEQYPAAPRPSLE